MSKVWRDAAAPSLEDFAALAEAAFAALHLPWRYLTMEVLPAALPDAIRGVRALGMQGVNLTIPHKVAVLPLLDEVSPDAARISPRSAARKLASSRWRRQSA